MEDFVKHSLLYDFYGELLTDHQKETYESYILENLSMSEIAAETGISRQGVQDMIRRCNAALDSYESRLHLVERFLIIRNKVKQIDQCDELDTARSIAEEILELL